jgi:hypothetical protein
MITIEDLRSTKNKTHATMSGSKALAEETSD